jgi:FOG: WD40 repeat
MEVTSVTELTDGRIASGSYDGTIRIWDLKKEPTDTGYCTILTGHTSFVMSVTELTDRRIASGSYDNTIRIWGTKTDA